MPRTRPPLPPLDPGLPDDPADAGRRAQPGWVRSLLSRPTSAEHDGPAPPDG